MNRRILALIGAVVASLALASSALASDCTNVSKSDPTAGAQILIDGTTGEILWTTRGLASRIELGLVDPASGEGFHGIVAIDVDGDGVADFSTYIVGPDDEIPLEAQFHGPACRGLTNLGLYFTECVGP